MNIITTYYQIKNWIKYHTSKCFFKTLSILFKSYPWDYEWMYELEKAKIGEMCNYLIKHSMWEDKGRAIRDMKICMNLIDIFVGNTKFWDIVWDEKYKTLQEKIENYRLVIHRKVNMSNLKRFVKNPQLYEFYEKFPHEFYILKAKALYHKIRNERDFEWWD